MRSTVGTRNQRKNKIDVFVSGVSAKGLQYFCLYLLFFLRLQEAEIYYISDLMGTENAAEFVRMWYVGVGIFSSAGVNY